jgi:hypothetical protein
MHLASRAAGLAAAASLVIGVYLIAWAARWPHSDLRESYAIAAGTVSAGSGVVAAVVAMRSRPGILPALAAAAAGAAAIVGGLVLAGVTGDQSEVCGDVLAACESLLPGL